MALFDPVSTFKCSVGKKFSTVLSSACSENILNVFKILTLLFENENIYAHFNYILLK